MWLGFKKVAHFLACLPPKQQLIRVAGAAPPSLHWKICHFSNFNSLSLVQYIEWHLVCACHQRTLGSHDLTYLGDPVPVTFGTSGHQSYQNFRILKNLAFHFWLWMSSAATWWQLWDWRQVAWKAQCVTCKQGGGLNCFWTCNDMVTIGH